MAKESLPSPPLLDQVLGERMFGLQHRLVGEDDRIGRHPGDGEGLAEEVRAVGVQHDQ